MSFDHPLLLLLLILPAAWIVWAWLHPGQPLRLPVDHGKLRNRSLLGAAVKLASSLPAVLMALALVLLAGPRKAAPPQEKRVMTNIILCVDISGSMGVTRFEAAMEEAGKFCERRKGDAFGLTVFGRDYMHWFPPTKDLSAIRGALPFVQGVRHLPWFAGTLAGRALMACRERLLLSEEGDRTIVLITDGGSSDFRNGRDLTIARSLADDGIRVFSILIGNDPPGPGINGVYNISSITSGKVFRAEDDGALAEIFSEIDRMQEARFEQVTAQRILVYRPFCIAALATAAAWLLGLLGLRFTPW